MEKNINLQGNKSWFGWCMYDWANSAFATVCLSAVLPVYFLTLVPEEGGTLKFVFGDRLIPGSALWGYAVSFSMMIVALSAPVMGALADRKGLHRNLLLTYCLMGAGSTLALFFAGKGNYLLVAGLFIIGNVSFAGGNVFYNAFLPVLADSSRVDRLSARGFAFGYIGGGLALAIVFILIIKHQMFGIADKAVATRIGFLLTGLWWAAFAIPTFTNLPQSANKVSSEQPGSLAEYLRILKELGRYKELLLFLIAFLCYNDGIQTIIVMAAVFGKVEIGLSQGAILGCFLMIQFLAMPGTLVFGRFAEKVGSKKAIVVSLVLFIFITIYAFFMKHQWEFWLLAVFVAIIFGGSQAISRSLFSSLVPRGKGGEFFGFYAISAKFASVLGPLVFALVTDLFHSTRWAILSLLIFFIVGMFLLFFVDVEKGKQAAMGEAE